MPDNSQQVLHTMRPVPEEAPKNGKIRVKLICPLYPVATLEADSVLLPAVDGDILILPERAPIFFNLTAGRMIIYNKGEQPISFMVSSGICEVRRNLCPVLAWGQYEEKIDRAAVEERLEKARKVFRNYRSDVGKSEAASRIEFFKKILELID